ncbi:MAG: hypothetical protein E2600_10515 [Chryseobacterium sp.]|nr:hypothetical protein [Chryseobacterium sp.]
MDKQVQSVRIKNLDDFLDSISAILNNLKGQRLKMKELQSLVDLDTKDYQSIQSIVDIVISLPDNDVFAPFTEIKKELILT